MKIFGIAGHSGMGKTTLLERLVPEIASRAHVRQVLPVIDEALRLAGIGLAELRMVAVATRPGYSTEVLPDEIGEEWKHREAPPALLHNSPHGHGFLLRDLDLDISATAIRADLKHDAHSSDTALSSLLPRPVLDYIRSHHLY
jgi:molybdopterin-guanine dinucleotide biosynthesis protein